MGEPSENGRIYPVAVWVADSHGPSTPRIRCGCHLVNITEQSVLDSDFYCYDHYCSNLLCFFLNLGLVCTWLFASLLSVFGRLQQSHRCELGHGVRVRWQRTQLRDVDGQNGKLGQSRQPRQTRYTKVSQILGDRQTDRQTDGQTVALGWIR